MVTCNEIINAADHVSTNVSASVTSTVSINAVNPVSMNFDDKKIGYKINCYILHTVLLVVILLNIIAIICYHYAKHRSKQKKYWLTNIKWSIMNF